MINAKKWLKTFLFLVLFVFLSVVIVNFIVDTNWSFSHKNQFNTKQVAFNERQQKTNNVFYNGLDKYDGILFGSSRTTFINQNDFYNMNIYNYAFNSMHPTEYEEYLNFAKKLKGQDFKYIIIGADFYNSMKRRNKSFENPKHYINNTQSFLYRYRMLLSADTLTQSLINIIRNIYDNNSVYYSRENVKYRPKVSEEYRQRAYQKNLKRHTKDFIGKNYVRNTNYINLLKRLKQENPSTKFIIFTSPITADLLVSVLKNGNKLDEFERWLKEIIEVFGSVNHFMTMNTITKNLENYADDDHYYPQIGKLLANKLSHKKNNTIPKDFGIVLDKSNIDSFMADFKKQLREYENPLEL